MIQRDSSPVYEGCLFFLPLFAKIAQKIKKTNIKSSSIKSRNKKPKKGSKRP